MIWAALAITIVVEGAIASVLIRAQGAGGRAQEIESCALPPAPCSIPWLETIAIQLTTWPVAQWLVWRTGAFWPVEAGVAIVETALWRVVLPMPLRRAALVSFVANGATALIALALS